MINITENIIAKLFDSYTEFSEYADNLYANNSAARQYVNGRYSNQAKIGKRFPNGWKQVLSSFLEPDRTVLNIYEDLLFDLRQQQVVKPQVIKRQTRFRDNGDEVDLDRLNSGQPFWRTMERGKQVGNQVKRIFINIASPWHRNPPEMYYRGAAGLALATLLEESGYTVEIWAGTCLAQTTLCDRDLTMAVCLKHSKDPLDIYGVSAAVSAWAYRTVWQMAKRGEGIRIMDHGGSPASLSTKFHTALFSRPFDPEDTFVIQDCWDKWDASARVKACLRGFQPKDHLALYHAKLEWEAEAADREPQPKKSDAERRSELAEFERFLRRTEKKNKEN